MLNGILGRSFVGGLLGELAKGLKANGPAWKQAERPEPPRAQPKGDRFDFSAAVRDTAKVARDTVKATGDTVAAVPAIVVPAIIAAPVAAKPAPMQGPVQPTAEPVVAREAPQADMDDEARARAFAQKAIATERMLNIVASVRAEPAETTKQADKPTPVKVDTRA